DGSYKYVNTEAERIFSMPLRDLVGNTDVEFFPSETAQQFAENDHRVIAEGSSLQTIEVLRQANGIEHHYLVSKFVVPDHEGLPAYLGGVAFDITELKRAEEEVKRLNADLAMRVEELAVANRELETFNYTVSHDLRNHLNTLSLQNQLVLEMYGEYIDEECRGCLQGISETVMRMSSLIDTLLKFSSITHTKIHLRKIDLSAMARDVSARLYKPLTGRKIVFRFADGVSVCGDANLLRILLENLLGNAVKFTSKQEIGVIEFGSMEIEREQVCFLRDNGIGFDNAHADKLFVPFQRLPGAEEFKGHGIGMATVERIIKHHGGRIWAEGEPGKGATFYFNLPDEEAR
ncbi:MAG TPA: ATP-binding protein, partial [Geobacteraceae bacterium]|nr:ATP-binding protein [Geobacteraceae bacterium]